MFILLPYHTQRSLKSRPVVTYTLIGLNLGLYLLALGLVFQGSYRWLVNHFGLVPVRPCWYAFLTHQFLHSPSPLHVLGNMFFLYVFGPSVEDILGRRKFVLFYLCSGLASALAHLLMTFSFAPGDLGVPLVGASGAVAGVMGMVAVRLYRTRISFWYFLLIFLFVRTGTFELPAAVALGLWVARDLASGLLEMATGLGSGIAYWAHVGGFALGSLWAAMMKVRVPEVDEYTYEDALKAARAGRWREARWRLDRVVQHGPDHAEAWQWLGRALQQTGYTESAVHSLARAWELYLQQGESGKAWEVYRELLGLAPRYPLQVGLEYRLASDLTAAGQYRAALRVLHRIVTLSPDAPEAEVALLQAGQIYLEKLSQPAEARRIFRAFCQRYPYSEWRSQAVFWEHQAAAQMAESRR